MRIHDTDCSTAFRVQQAIERSALATSGLQWLFAVAAAAAAAAVAEPSDSGK